MKRLYIILALILMGGVASAATPQRIDYQGYLMQSNIAVTGTKSIVFSLYDASTGGTQLCTSGPRTITVTKGVFTYGIGSGGCTLSGINFDNPVYLELNVEGTALSPREQVAGAAYSVQMKAANVIYTPAGNVSATDVQAAITELDTEKLDKTGGALTGNVNASSTISADFFVGNGAGITNITTSALDHNTLSNLTAGDVHTQYVKKAGDTMTGALTATAFTGDGSAITGIVTAGLVNDAITSTKILDGTIASADVAFNYVGSIDGVVNKDGDIDLVAGTGMTITPNDGANTITIAPDPANIQHDALAGLGDDDHPQYFALAQNETVTGIPAFNGGTSGGGAPFTVDSTDVVSNLNADLLDGNQATAFVTDGCTDCLNATEISDIYVLNTADSMSGTLTVGSTLTVNGAISSTNMTCRGGCGSVLFVNPGGGGAWGSWGGVSYCPSNYYVCGARHKTEGDQGSGDDTALNAIGLACCPF